MAYKLFVGGLSFNTSDDTLQAGFAQYGTIVSATVVKDRETGRSKGFGFVEFETEEQGKAAIAALDAKEFDGRTISVSEARPREDRPRRDFGGNSHGGGNRW